MNRSMVLTDSVERALIFAARKHEGQTRKGSDTPYITHPVAVAAMVHEAGGGEDAVVAALLHDTVEDCGGLPVLEEIRTTFGETVAAIVDALTDSYDQDREKWQVRKERYIAHIATAAPSRRLSRSSRPTPIAVCEPRPPNRSDGSRTVAPSRCCRSPRNTLRRRCERPRSLPSRGWGRS